MMKLRGFEVVKRYKNSNINLPKRMTHHAAGYDIEAATDVEFAPGEIILVPTGLKAYMQNDEVLYLYSRSSLPMKKGLILTNSVGVIDADYYNNPNNDGHLLIQMKNTGDQPAAIKKGERIAQAVFAKYLLAGDDDGQPKQQRRGGFGSTQ